MCAAVYRQRHLMKATEVTAGLAESNGSLLPGLLRDSLHVTCGLTACTPGSAPGPTLDNEYGKTLPFYCCSRRLMALRRLTCHISVALCPLWCQEGCVPHTQLGATSSPTRKSRTSDSILFLSLLRRLGMNCQIFCDTRLFQVGR